MAFLYLMDGLGRIGPLAQYLIVSFEAAQYGLAKSFTGDFSSNGM